MGSSNTKQYRELPEDSSGPDVCTVWCWTRPLESWASSSSSSSNYTGNQSSGFGFAFIQHWMAAFQYEDEVLVCDANDVEGDLQGKCQQMKIDNFEKECPVDKKFLGKFKIPKQEVKGKVDQLRNCGPYYFISNNCQKWLRALLKKMKLPDTGYTDGQTALFIGLGALMFAGIGYSIYTTHQHYKLERQIALKRRAQSLASAPVDLPLKKAKTLGSTVYL